MQLSRVNLNDRRGEACRAALHLAFAGLPKLDYAREVFSKEENKDLKNIQVVYTPLVGGYE
ncbi:hypothetical protein GCM10011611_48330 [Aliidongia dinghuensis]|uniref:Uncharacterized protein n=1 Tax=Aliidongia dinghuensis TaxID=1867774 RepID=A0A8J2YXW6_9PROT|nr:hypothetical protein GCM10011611_48330 [Aliidongia dinghuensis]